MYEIMKKEFLQGTIQANECSWNYHVCSWKTENSPRSKISCHRVIWQVRKLKVTGVVYMAGQITISIYRNSIFISSPELKTQVRFSDHLSSVVCPSVHLSVNFSQFHLLLQNHWANFNQTWHKVALGEGDSSLSKWRTTPFPKGG